MDTPTRPLHPRERSLGHWRASLAAMASHGETSGARVDEARAAVAWHRHRTFLVNDVGLTLEQAEDLLDWLREPAPDDEPPAPAPTPTEALVDVLRVPEAVNA